MKRSKMFPLVLSLMFILGFHGVAFSMGYEDPACQSPPAPTSGPYLYGTFTVALDEVTLGIEGYEHYNVHVVLWHRNNQHLFSFPAPVEQLGVYNLCDYVASFVKTEFAKIPCNLGVGEAFGLTGFPVITNLYIVKRDFCGTEDEMISGLITIRVVPPVPPKPPRR
jgi:hypothetical protein